MPDVPENPYVALRRLLIHGQLPAGMKMNESDWTKRLESNRIAVREAMVLLAHEGLLRRGEKSGFFVPSPERRDLEEVMEVRAIVEAGAIRLFINRGPEPDEIAALRKTCDLMQANLETGVELGFVEADRNFHRQIVEFSRNQRLADLYDHAALPLTPSAIADPKARHAAGVTTIAEHRSLCDLIAERRLDDAVALLEAHLNTAHHLAPLYLKD